MHNIFIFIFIVPLLGLAQSSTPTTEATLPKPIVNWPEDGYPSTAIISTVLKEIKSKDLSAAKEEVRKEFPKVIQLFFYELKKNSDYNVTNDDILSTTKSFEESVSTVNVLPGLDFLYNIKNFRLFLLRRAELVWRRTTLEKIKSLEAQNLKLAEKIDVLDKKLSSQPKLVSDFSLKKPFDFYHLLSILSLLIAVLILSFEFVKYRSNK